MYRRIRKLPLHVAILHPSMHFLGGAERLMTDLALGLADRETRVDLIAGLCHATWKSELCANASVSVREVGQRSPGSLEFWLSVRGCAKALRRLIDPDTNVIVTSSFPSSLAARMFTQEHDAKVVHYLHEAPMVLHDKDGVKALPFPLKSFYRMMSALYAKDDIEAVTESDTIIANSRLTREANSKAYAIDQSRIELIYPGVNTERMAPSGFVPTLIADYVKEGIPIVFTPKGAQFWRNPQICLQALTKLVFPFRAVFTGGTRNEGDSLLKRARALGIAESVLWTQELSTQELSGLYSHSAVVVSVPKRQPFGLIPLEALMHGAPPIVSSSSGVSEVLRDQVDAIRINEGNPEDLANALQALISDDEMRRGIVSSGRGTILKRLTLTRFVNEMREKIFT